MRTWKLAFATAFIVLGPCAAYAQTPVSLPNSSQTTTLTASVSDQAKVTVPSGITFTVSNIGVATAATAASVTVENIVLAAATNQLKISLQGNAASFTPPVAGAATWAVGDVTWNAATWTNATGAGATLSNSAFNTVATCAADTGTCSTTALVFTLAAKPTVKRSGSHTLIVTWKFESI